VASIDLVFSSPERREQARSYVKDCYLHGLARAARFEPT
jgi:hypothetical protein